MVVAEELRILILEDEPTDAALEERELLRAGLKFVHTRADRRDVFARALDEFRPDIVLVDYKLPDFDGLSAVKFVRAKSADLPVILVTGALRDEAALEVIKAGANDYVLKDGLARLPFAVRRVLLQAEESRARRRAERALKTLSAGNQALVRASDEPTLLTEMCRAISQTGGYRLAWIGIAEQDKGKTVRPAARFGPAAALLDHIAVSWDDVPLGHGPTGTAIRTGTIRVNRGFATDPAILPWRAEALSHGLDSSIALPLKGHTEVFGALTIYAAERDAFDAVEQALLTELAGDLSYGVGALRDRVERDASVERLQRSLEATIGAIASTIEKRDPYTAGHQRRVAHLAATIAGEMGLPKDQARGIYLAGLIHDVGKINVPAEILSKPGQVSPLEIQLIRTHVQAGYDIIKGVEFPWPIAEAILQHHERLDGSGYPRGLPAQAIILEARILAVADVTEAITAHRPYRPAVGLQAALAEIEAGRGRLYDEGAADACLALFRSKGFMFQMSGMQDDGR